MQLGDVVWFDENANAIQDAGENPIPNATVELFLADGSPAVDIHGNAVAAQQTNANGEYLFTPLAPGDYMVRVTPMEADFRPSPGAEPDPNTDDNTDSNGLDVDGEIYAQSGVVTLEHDKEPMHDGDLENPNSNLTVDFGFYIPVSVGDLVWFDRNGNGVQEMEDIGIADATVSLYQADGETPVLNAEGVLVASQTTAEDGKYLFDTLLPGDYVVSVQIAEPYEPTQGGSDPDDDNNTDSNALPFEEVGISHSLPVTLMSRTESVLDGDSDPNTNLTVDFGFIRPMAIGNYIWNDINADGIQDAVEVGLAGATVSLMDNAGNPVTDLKGNPVDSMVTGETGDYLFNYLPEGDYIVRVQQPGNFVMTFPFQNTTTVDDDIDSNCTLHDNDVVQTAPISLLLGQQPDVSTDGDNTDRNMTIDCGFYSLVQLGDLIWADDGDGVQEDGEPGIPGAIVTLLGEDGEPTVVHYDGTPVAPQITDSEGHYLFDNLIPGEYSIQVQLPEGYGSAVTIGGLDPDETLSGDGFDIEFETDSNCIQDDSGIFTLPLTLDSEEHALDLDCGFVTSYELGDLVWIDLNGNGIQDEGEPRLAGAIVTLIDAQGNPVYDIFGNKVEPQITDENGHYLFTNLPAGEYILHVDAPVGYQVSIGGNDPDDDNPVDNNGMPDAGAGAAMSLPITLGDEVGGTNVTVDFAFVPVEGVHIPTLSEWAYIIMLLMLLSVAGWKLRERDHR
jgi:protocatechuate 3,4-dioxygenase beta subunit